jgi:hypothetical protein
MAGLALAGFFLGRFSKKTPIDEFVKIYEHSKN